MHSSNYGNHRNPMKKLFPGFDTRVQKPKTIFHGVPTIGAAPIFANDSLRQEFAEAYGQ